MTSAKGDSGMPLADAIEELRRQLTEARSRGANADLQFPIRAVTVELQLVVTKEGEGRAGFKVPVIDLELGASGSYGRETTHTLTVEFGEPVDRKGQPVRVDRMSSRPLD